MSEALETARGAAIAVAVGRPAGSVEEFLREPVDYDAFLAHRTVQRLRGVAVHGARRVPWSLIEKTTEGPRLASPYLRDNAERELAAYSSGLLDDLAPRVRAPHLLGTHEDADGRITLWLEEVQDRAPHAAEGDALIATARDLGTLAGRWLGAVPVLPWLFTDWIERHGQPQAVAAGLRTLGHAGTGTAERLGGRLDEVQRLIRAQPRLRVALEALPQTLCHHDAVGANVLRSDASTVLVDWESVGPGPVGADLASLLFASVRRGDASATLVRTLLDDAIAAYIDGMAEASTTVDAAIVRRGVDAAIGLRWKLAVDVVDSLERGVAPRRGSAPDEAPDQALEQLTQLTGLLLDAARRALEVS